ncbi:MAG: hypothetical protein ABW195_17055 [Ilumatobacteraceae bacterium]
MEMTQRLAAESVEHPWYIDAWAVHDGRLFASRRAPDSIVATSTVFMSVPDLEPVPVGRISTALRATRSGFQEGLRDSYGEIPFESLEQVRDLVKRAYLAAGLGPGAPGAIAGPITSPFVPGGPGSAYLQERQDRLDEWWVVEPPTIPTSPPTGLESAVAEFATASLLEWDAMLEPGEPEVTRAFLGWTRVLTRCGALTNHDGDFWLDHSLHGLPEFARRHGANGVAAAASALHETDLHLWWLDAQLGLSGWFRGHLANVPLPSLSRWDTRLRRLTEMSILPVVDRRFWRQRRAAVDIAPMVLVAMTRRLPHVGRLPGEPSQAELAFADVSRSLRWVTLPPTAERALEQFIDRCLSVDPPVGTPTPGMQSRPAGHEADPPTATASHQQDGHQRSVDVHWRQDREPPSAMAHA